MADRLGNQTRRAIALPALKRGEARLQAPPTPRTPRTRRDVSRERGSRRVAQLVHHLLPCLFARHGCISASVTRNALYPRKARDFTASTPSPSADAPPAPAPRPTPRPSPTPPRAPPRPPTPCRTARRASAHSPVPSADT